MKNGHTDWNDPERRVESGEGGREPRRVFKRGSGRKLGEKHTIISAFPKKTNAGL